MLKQNAQASSTTMTTTATGQRDLATRTGKVACSPVAVAVPWSWPWAVAATAIVLGVASADLRSARRQSSTTCSLTLARAGRESTSLREHSVQSPGRVSAEKVRCRRYGRFNRRVPLSHPLRHWHRVSCTEAEAGDCANLDHAADPGSTNRRPIYVRCYR